MQSSKIVANQKCPEMLESNMALVLLVTHNVWIGYASYQVVALKIAQIVQEGKT